MSNYLHGMGSPDTVIPKNWSPAFLYFKFISLTPPILQFYHIQMDDIGGEIVQQISTYVSAPLPMKCFINMDEVEPRKELIDSNMESKDEKVRRKSRMKT